MIIKRFRLKTILLAFTTLVTLLLSATVLAFWDFEKTMDKKLESKQFLKSTSFYTEGYRIFLNAQTTPQEVLNQLHLLQYRPREIEQKILAGDYFFSNADSCQKLLTIQCPIGTNQWIVVKTDNQSSSLSKFIFWNEKNEIIDLRSGPNEFNFSTNQPVSELSFEPQLLAQYIDKDPVWQEEIQLSQAPPLCLNAVIAIEDQRFLDHSGVSVTGILRAIGKNILTGRKAQGGSTITQQLVKNYFLSSERTYKRKAQEIAMAISLESKFTKDEILQTYLNVIYLGQNGPFQVRGYGAASKFYFQKNLSDLNLSECTLLAAIVNSPGLFNPWTKKENAKKRRSLVLEKMLELGFISENQKKNAESQPLPIKNPQQNVTETAPYFIDAARKQAKELNIDIFGKKVFLSLDLKNQKSAQDAVQAHIENLENSSKLISKLKKAGQNLEGVLLSVDNQSGLIRAAVGGRSFKITQYNRITEAHRQIGSIMKPIVFLSALEFGLSNGQKFTPISILKDEPKEFSFQNQKWSPENYGKKYFGEVPAYFALKNSLNSVTAQLALDVGLPKVIQTAQKLGAVSSMKALPSLSLGAFEMYPKEVLDIYHTIALMGNGSQTSFIKEIADENNNTIWKFTPQRESKFSSTKTAELVGMMKHVILSGSGKMISTKKFPFESAGKTGTTSDYKDTWFAGFTAYQTTVTWVGYDNNLETGLTGASGAVPIWLNYMIDSHKGLPLKNFSYPETVELKVMDFEIPSSKEIEKEIPLIFEK